MRTPTLSVIIPAYNEEKNIGSVIKNIPKIQDLNVLIIVIDDGSSDKTAAIAEKAGALVFSHVKNLGLGTTVRTGLKKALELGGDIFGILDGDGQYDPRILKSFVLNLLNEKADLILGNRFLLQQATDANFIKIIANKLISHFISRVLLQQDAFYDVQSSFRVFNRKLALRLEKLLKGRYNYAQEMFIITSMLHYKINQQPIKCVERSSGKSKLIRNPVEYLVRIFWISFKTFFRLKMRFYNK